MISWKIRQKNAEWKISITKPDKTKLKWLEVTNKLVGDSNSDEDEMRCQLQSDSKSNKKIWFRLNDDFD